MHIHFVGCAGASMKVLMRLAQREGATVSGSDLSLGGHDASFARGADMVVYSSAVPDDNPERTYACAHRIPVLSRAEFLGQVASHYRTVIAVAGSHGKTTVTAMLGSIFLPYRATVHLGGECETLPSLGSKRFFLTEACEYRRNFLYLSPRVSVVLNVELDHTDYYRDLADVTSAFDVFSRSAPVRILRGDDENSAPLRTGKFVTFGMREDCEYYPRDVRTERGGATFTLMRNGNVVGQIALRVPGRHNVCNAVAAAATAMSAGLSFSDVQKGLYRFGGVKRRLERLGKMGACDVFTDYAHHPREIESTLSCLRDAGYKKLGVAFEPHTYSRTLSLLPDFVRALMHADDILLAEIFAAREAPRAGVSGQLLCREIMQSGASARCFPTFFQLNEAAKQCMTYDDVFVYMGAGIIDIAGRNLFGGGGGV